MQKIILPFLAFVVALAFANKPSVQTQNAPPASPHLPRGTATDVSGAEIQSLVQKTAADRVSDQAIRVVSINGEYNVGLGAVHRAKTSGAQAGGTTPSPTLYSPLMLTTRIDRKSTRLNSSHLVSSYAVFCFKKKNRC